MYNLFQNAAAPASINGDETSVLMTAPEMAAYLGIGRNMAYQLLNEGTIRGFKIGSQWKVSKLAVDQYIMEKSGFNGMPRI